MVTALPVARDLREAAGGASRVVGARVSCGGWEPRHAGVRGSPARWCSRGRSPAGNSVLEVLLPFGGRPRLYAAVRGIGGTGGPAHVHMVDSVVVAGITRWRLRSSQTIWRWRQERSVKPSAQPTLVRTQHLPLPAETAPWLRKRGVGAVFFLSRHVSRRITVSRCVAVSTDV